MTFSLPAMFAGGARAGSLKWNLVWRLVRLQSATAMVFAVAGMTVLWAMGFLIEEPDARTLAVLQEAIARDAQGRPTLRQTPRLAQLQAEDPSLWFIVRDRAGHRLARGVVPPQFKDVGDSMNSVSSARLTRESQGHPTLTAYMSWIDTDMGSIQVLIGTDGRRVPLRKFIVSVTSTFMYGVLPFLALMVLATLVSVPLAVRKSLAGLAAVAAQAGMINFDQRGTRLSEQDLSSEVTPLVRAVNGALARLDEGYERYKRFLVSAAHELRTPIAILQTRSESIPEGSAKIRLQEDIGRLATLAEQLLDLQRLDQGTEFSRVDLVAVGRRVAADMAPLAIAAGYDVHFESEAEHVGVYGDPAVLERAVTNLVRNAIEHGGRRGAITVRVCAGGMIEVADEGPGVAPEHRERIFEPFYRVQPLDRGAGLGLNLVREIVTRHHGQVQVLDRAGGGACFRITLPLHTASDRSAMLT